MELKNTFYGIVCALAFTTMSYGQVGIGTLDPEKSSQLDITATNKGLLIPRVKLTQLLLQAPIVGTVATSLLVFNTETINDVTPGFYFWNGLKWVRMINKGDASTFKESITTLVNNGNGIYTYTNEKGDEESINITEVVKSQQTLTSLFYNSSAQILTYKDENENLHEITLTGLSGPQGPQGLPGTNGVDGATGSQGAQGLQGLPGTNGVDGATGSQGTQGLQGLPGTNGVDGAVGPQGAQGLQGLPGTNGVDGAVGPQGAQGLQGLPGTNGVDGAVGPQGPAGTPPTVGAGNLTSNDYITITDGLETTFKNTTIALDLNKTKADLATGTLSGTGVIGIDTGSNTLLRNANVKINPGTSGQVLTTNTAGTVAWQTPSKTLSIRRVTSSTFTNLLFEDVILIDASAAAPGTTITLDLPISGSSPMLIGKVFTIKRVDSNNAVNVDIATGSRDLIEGTERVIRIVPGSKEAYQLIIEETTPFFKYHIINRYY